MSLSKRGGWPYANPPNTQFELNRQSPQAQGLVAWWPTLGQYGNTATVRDYIANRYPMTQNNAPTWKGDGQFGQTLLFDDGASQYLSAAKPVATEYPFTMSCWFNTNDSSINQGLIQLVGVAGGVLQELRLRDPPDNDVIMLSFATGNAFAKTSTSYSTNTWHHACGIVTSDTDRRVYLDAGGVGTDANNQAYSGNIDATWIARSQIAPSFYMSGKLADVRIYNRALSAAEVWAMYDPATRWELYAPVISRGIVLAPSGITVPLFMHHYRQMRIRNGV